VTKKEIEDARKMWKYLFAEPDFKGDTIAESIVECKAEVIADGQTAGEVISFSKIHNLINRLKNNIPLTKLESTT